jgi:hypothetical protein
MVIAALLLTTLAGAVPIGVNQLNLTQLDAYIDASLTTGDNYTMTASTPAIVHVGNAYSDQLILLPAAAGNVSKIYTISFDTFSAYRVYVNASPGTITENLSIVCGDVYQFLSNGTMWANSVWQVAPS